MKLELRRYERSANGKATIGRLYADGTEECFTLEDQVRPEGEPKVQNATAIPAGTYQLTIDFSNRFQRSMPHILDVSGFDGIRIHAGNTDVDTDGCVLLGQVHNVGEDFVGGSQAAFQQLFAKLQEAAQSGEASRITITNQF